MTRQQVRKHDRIFTGILMILAVIMVVHMTTTTIRGNQRQREQQKEIHEQPDIRETQRETQTEPEEVQKPDKYAVFDTMSADWGSEDVEGFTLYEIPEEYKRTGGYFPEKVQVYTYCICRQYGVSYELVIAMIEHESGYRFDAAGDDGNSVGYMQIYESCHEDRMERLGCNDLKNPYQNIVIGVDYLAELLKKYNTEDALAAYNYGAAGARKHLWSNGIHVYDYNREIMNRMKEIEEELRE